MQDIKSILRTYDIDVDKQVRISREFQDFAYRLAVELEDLSHKSLYMRLAKNTERGLLEEARNFVKGALKANNKGRLFMWKLSELKKAKAEKFDTKTKSSQPKQESLL